MRTGIRAGLLAGAIALATAACTAMPAPSPSGVPVPSPGSSASAEPSGPVQPAGAPVVLVSGLTSPWSVVRLDSGSALISERDTGAIIEYTASGTTRAVGTVPGVAHGGEGGLLGIATLAPADSSTADRTTWLYAYFTASDDNRIVRMPLRGGPGAYELGGAEVILSGIAKARNHNGGRIAFGPDGMLYATAGDAARPPLAQDPGALNGKILRMAPDGGVPDDNPTPGSLVYSMGHRNPQGIAWDDRGRLWSSEFGQNTWDELNLIEPGGNYGWPDVEGVGGQAGFIDPIVQWSTAEASPSGLAYVRDTLFLAALRGQRLWVVYPTRDADAAAWFTTEFGRLRDAVPGPDGTLWLLTNNTDGRGSPTEGDDKLLQISLEPID